MKFTFHISYHFTMEETNLLNHCIPLRIVKTMRQTMKMQIGLVNKGTRSESKGALTGSTRPASTTPGSVTIRTSLPPNCLTTAATSFTASMPNRTLLASKRYVFSLDSYPFPFPFHLCRFYQAMFHSLVAKHPYCEIT